MSEKKFFQVDHLRSFCENVFKHYGHNQENAALATDVLMCADLRGIDSHGVARLYSYVELLEAKRINPNPKISITRSTASTATVDGDNGLGLVVGPKANKIAIEKAKDVGTGWVTVFNTNHYGIAGYYVLEALKEDIIGWSMTNSTALVAPHGGMERMLGTNPIAIGFPGGEEPPVIIDMATSAVAYGKIEMVDRKEEAMPDGWGLDSKGNQTNIPNELKDGGSMLPLGSGIELSGHKGYALSTMVDVLTSVLSGANWGPFAPGFTLQNSARTKKVGKGIGHFFGAMCVEAFRDMSEFKEQMDDWVRTFRETKPAPGYDKVLIPGDPERLANVERNKTGIPLIKAVEDELKSIAKLTSVEF